MKKLLQAGLLLISFGFYNNLFGQGIFHIKNPAGLSGMYNFSRTDKNYGGNVDSIAISGRIVKYSDTTGCTVDTSQSINNTYYPGGIILVDRGMCNFAAKILNAQQSGAAAVIIVNNVPNSAPFTMGEDTSKTRFINIPAIMISYEDGAKIKSNLDSNGTTAYIGKLAGYFDNDLLIAEAYVSRPRNFATPKELVNETNNPIKLGAWVTNNGKTTQNAVTLKAEVFIGTKLIHSVTNTIDTLITNQKKWFGLAPLVSSIYPNGYYTIKYTVNSDKADDFNNNNQVTSNFHINDSIFSKSRVDSIGRPISNTNAGSNIDKWCVVLNEPKAGNIKVNGLTFATVSQTDSIHTGASVTASFYEWSDNLSDSITFNNLNLLESTSYTYKINESNVFITSKFNAPIVLENGKRYMGCLEKNNANLWILADNQIDYLTTMGSNGIYYEPFFPFYIAGTNQWHKFGYGTNIVPAILINTSSNLAPTDTSNSAAWKRKADFIGEGKNGSVGFSIGNKGYIGSGHDTSSYKNSFWEYDPLLDVWSQKANLPGPSRISAIGMNIGDKGYLGLGENGADSSALNDFWQFNPDSNMWSQKANLPGLARSQAVSFSIGNKGYVGTGVGKASTKDLNDFWEYDPANDAWTQKANFGGKARSAATGFSIRGKGYIGMGADGWYLNDFWEYNPTSDSWVQKNNVNFGGRIFSVGLSVGNKGYIATGNSADGLKKDFWEYDPLSDSWTERENFSGNVRLKASGFSIGNSIYIGAGENGDRISGNYIKNDFWEYKVNLTACINTGEINNSTCINSGFDVPFQATCSFDSTNIFIAQLSDSAGKFENPLNIGSLQSNQAGIIKAKIPGSVLPSSKYRIRVISNSPVEAGTLNSNGNITIKKAKKLPITTNNGSNSINCKGEELILNANGGINLLWNDSSTFSSKTINKAGKYFVFYSDSIGCSDSSSIEITEKPILKSQVATKDIKCFGNNDGVAIAKVTGGTAPYNYRWFNDSTKDTVDMLIAGTYYLYVTDSLSCKDSISFEIKQPSKLKTNLIAKNINCFGFKNGELLTEVSGGTTPYQFDWSNGSKLGIQNNLEAGNYSITITDSMGCKDSASIEIKQPKALSTELSALNVLCFGDATGEVSANISGGKPPYQLNWSNGSKNNSAGSLKAGKYSISVIDSLGCKDSAEIEIKQPELLKATVASENARCFGNKDGKATTKVIGGIEPYSFNWSNGSKKDTLKNIVSGTYYLLVTDSAGCKDSSSFVIKHPSEITLTTTKNDATCGNTTGFATVNATGGVGGYNYLWSNQSTQVAIGNLMAGGYTVTVTDTNNCSKTGIVNIGNTNGPILDSIFQQATSCAKNCDGSANIIIKGGKEPYTYVWNNNSAKNTAIATGLCMGINSVKVKDADNCAIGAYIEVTALMPDPVFAGNVTINGEKLTSGNVQLYKYSKSQGAFRILGYSDIDSDGKYSITGMQSGSYILAVNPDTNNYPLAKKTYYSGKEKWIMADTIMAYCDKIEEINLTVIELPEQTGLGKISGKIVDNTNGKRTSEPLPGIDVSLEEEPDSKIIATTKTDENGNYLFTNIELGKYKIYVDIPGLGMTSTYKVEVQTEDSVVTDQDFFVDSTGTINVEVKSGIIKKTKLASFELYPNPSKDKIYLVSDYTKQIQVHVINLLGKEVYVSNNLKSGDFVDLTNLEAGVYYFKINTADEEIIKMVIKQ